MSEWISVKDRLPDEFGEYLGLVDEFEFRGPEIVQFDEDGFQRWYNYEWNKSHVTHWMPLPEPPEETL